MKLSSTEQSALEWLKKAGGSILITAIEDKNRSDGFGNIIPGLLVFKKLEKKGLVFFTKEDPIDINGEPFYFTPSVELDYQAFNKLVKDEPARNLMAKSK